MSALVVDRSGVEAKQPGRAQVAKTINPLMDDRWQLFVERSPDACIFHHHLWLELLHAQYRYPIYATCLLGADGEISAGLPFALIRSPITGSRLVALPFSDLCPPLTRDGDPSAVVDLVAAVGEQQRADGLDVEIRAQVGGTGHAGVSFYHHQVPLAADAESVQAGFKSGVTRGVRKAARVGIEVVRRTDGAALDEFYRLHLITRRRQGMPTQPKRFIRRFSGLFEQGLGFVLLAKSEGRTVAASVFLTFNQTLTYKYGASDPSRLNGRPNNALFMEAIRWGCENGYRSFDLGRTDLDNQGLRSFKNGWGADERLLTYTHLSLSTEASSSSPGIPKIAKAVISRTPPLTSRIVGAALYRHFG